MDFKDRRLKATTRVNNRVMILKWAVSTRRGESGSAASTQLWSPFNPDTSSVHLIYLFRPARIDLCQKSNINTLLLLFMAEFAFYCFVFWGKTALLLKAASFLRL